MVGGRKIFSEPEGPEDLQNRSQPRQGPGVGISLAAPRQPMSEAGERLAQKGTGGLGRVQAASPAAGGGGIGQAIRVFERRHRLFPGAVLQEASPQRLTSSQQAVMAVRERKQREEGEGRPATGAATAPDPDPVVVFIVRLLAAASMADDRIAFTPRAAPQDDLVAVFGPIGFELARRGGKWDKKNRSPWGLCVGVDLPRSEPEAEPLLLKTKFQLEENNASQLRLLRV